MLKVTVNHFFCVKNLNNYIRKKTSKNLKMGCVNSKADINDTHPNIFHVINVNDRGKACSSGKLEVTDEELILHQKGKNPIIWPLKSLRKYGWDNETEMFSIECGRRCSTGAGYYAFKCKRAELVFNMVQFFILGGVVPPNNDIPNLVQSSNTHQNNTDIPAINSNSAIPQRSDNSNVFSRLQNGIVARPGSTSSIGQLSPIAPTNETPNSLNNEHNNNQNDNSAIEHGIVPSSQTFTYVNITPEVGNESQPCHLYMNVDTKEICNSLSQNTFLENNKREYQKEDMEELHCYANIDAAELENLQILRKMSSGHQICSIPSTPTVAHFNYIVVKDVNYAELDLDSTNKSSKKIQFLNGNDAATEQPNNQNNKVVLLRDSPTIERKSYATIDFPKTIALNQSVKPGADLEEGSRKTRHNSTINSFSD